MRARRRPRLHALNVAPIAALFCKNPTFSPLLLSLLVVELVELVSGSTIVVIVMTPPSERVEINREIREAESLAVEVGNSEVVEGSDEVDWEVVEGVEELEKNYL